MQILYHHYHQFIFVIVIAISCEASWVSGNCFNDIALHGKPISALQSITCHMGSHSVTCHLTPMNAPRL